MTAATGIISIVYDFLAGPIDDQLVFLFHLLYAGAGWLVKLVGIRIKHILLRGRTGFSSYNRCWYRRDIYDRPHGGMNLVRRRSTAGKNKYAKKERSNQQGELAHNITPRNHP